MKDVAAVLVAAGRGTRLGGDLPKQFRMVDGRAILDRALSAFAEHPQVAAVQPVIHPDDMARYRTLAPHEATLAPVFGGTTRQASVRAGLEALSLCKPDIVLVHDAARPFVTPALIERAIAAASRTGAAVPALPVSDTVKIVDASGIVERTLERSALRLIQTPQAFAFSSLLEAHRKATKEGREDFTDDAALAEWAGLTVTVFDGEKSNVKITDLGDLARAESERFGMLSDVRIGTGIDVHAFGPGDHVWLGGIRIPHTQTLTGHSDADVVLHALVDAILGALAEGDIGSHFPPSDAKWKGAASDQFLAFAVARVKARGGRIAHLDVTVVCEAPRVGPYRDAMREKIAALTELPLSRVAVKATTSEQLGFTGRREGILAQATATLRLPGE